MIKQTLPPKLHKGALKASPPSLAKPNCKVESETVEGKDRVQLSAAKERSKPLSQSLFGKLLTLGMLTTALVGCSGPGAAEQVMAQQLAEPAVLESMANPFELMRMDDGSIAVSADLQKDDAYVLAAGAAIRQDGGADIALKTKEGTSLCEQAQALGGTCLNEEQVLVSDPSGPLLIETFNRPGEAVHRLEAKPADGISIGGVELNKLPAGTEVFSDNGSGLLRHDGRLELYPKY